MSGKTGAFISYWKNMMVPKNRKTGIRASIQRWLPWMVTAGIFIVLFARIPMEQILEAAARVNLWAFLPIITISVVLSFFWDALISTFLFRGFGVPVTYREMIPVSGAAYLVRLLNYIAGMGGLALLMSRWKRISISSASSIVIFNLFLDYFTLLGVCLLGAFQLPDVDLKSFFSNTESGSLVRFITISWLIFGCHICFYRLILPRSNGLERVKKSDMLFTFRQAPVSKYGLFIFLKALGMFFFGLVVNYFVLHLFNLHVPFLYLSAMLPIVWLIEGIPISVMGMGTGQAAMLWLVAGFAEGQGGVEDIEAAVLTYSLMGMIAANAVRFIIGAVCVWRLPKGIWGRR
jgi:hypothetical protein